MEGDSTERRTSLGANDRFPATVTDSTEHPDGLTLHLLDEGTQEDPRYIHIYDDERETEVRL